MDCEQSPLPSCPNTPENELGQLWFQSYNAWFKREKEWGRAHYSLRESKERKTGTVREEKFGEDPVA